MDTLNTSRAPDGFDVSLDGTPEQDWLTLLEESPFENGAINSLLIVAPHPDDETLGAGGLIHHCVQARIPTRLICVTQGEAAWPGVADLAGIRALELQQALACLCSAGIEVSHLQIPDGRVPFNEQRLQRAIDERLHCGDTLVAPFEHDGHPDHDAVGRVCVDIARQRGVTLLRYPIWAWHRLKPEAFQASSFLRIALSEQAQSAKVRAIGCFTSQLEGLGGRSPILPVHVLRHFTRPYEAFLKCPTK